MSNGMHACAVGRVVLALSVVAVLAGCQSFREAAGITKKAPDEFAVVTKAPLIIPPDFNLKPPQPGAAPLNQASPTVSAESSLFNTDPSVIASTITGNYSQGEKLLLANAGAANADHGIRQQIAADNKNMQAADEDFTSKLLFSTPSSNANVPIDPDAEKKRMDEAKTSGTTPAPAPADSPAVQKDSGGWLDGIF